MVALGYGPEESATWANDVSWFGGTVVGGASGSATLAVYWDWRTRSWSGPTSVPATGAAAAEALGIGAEGTIVGWADLNGERRAWSYDRPVGVLPGRFDWFAQVPGAVTSEACDMTKPQATYADKIAVGTSGNMPARWVNHAGQTINVSSGATGGRFTAITADQSTMIGWATFEVGPNEVDQAMRCLAGLEGMSVQMLGEGGSSRALDVTADGETIVGVIDWGTGPTAFIWDPMNALRSLSQVLEYEQGLDLAGWTLQRATGISGDGMIIVGTGINPLGRTEAWRVRLESRATRDVHNPDGQPLALNETLALPVSQRNVEVASTVTSSGLLSVAQVRPESGCDPEEACCVPDAALEAWRDEMVAGMYPQMWAVELTADHGPVTLTFHYDPAGLVDVEEELICLYHWRPEQLQWVSEEGIIDINHATFTTTVTDLSVFSLGVVPEPTTVALLALGMLRIGLRRRPGRKAKA